MLALSFGAWSIACLLTPGSAKRPALIMVARVIVGIFQGFIIPAVHTVLAQVGQVIPAPSQWQLLCIIIGTLVQICGPDAC
jgi:hypothetical protein